MTAPQDVRFAAQMIFEMMQAMQISTTAIALYMIRFVIVMSIFPVTGDQIVNNMSRMGIAFMLAMFTSFIRPWNELDLLTGPQLGFIAVKEILLGVALGFAMSTVFWVVEFAGALIDTAAGFNSVQIQNPMSGQQSTPVSDMMVKLAGAVFFSVGGGIFFVQAMFESYQVWPVADLLPSAHKAYEIFIQQQLGQLFSNTVKLAAPVLTVVFLIDIGVGMLARSAEKLEPSSLSQPLKGIVVVVMLTLFVSVAFDELRNALLPRDIVQRMSISAPR